MKEVKKVESRTHQIIMETCPVFYDVKVMTETIVRNDAVTYYKGPTSVVPKTEPTTLETKNKFLTENITVFKIPYWETTNQNGTTVYIGGEENHGI